ncbi:MAG: radical SAM protein, partial [Lentisphaerae bacterium]|nr:radical SAM protein [Lentisphaerota bacterium]
SLQTIKRLGIWLEVTTLVIPGINDDAAELGDAVAFIAEKLGVETPWHISRFFPTYKLADVPPTPESTLEEAAEIGRAAGLRYVYLGNVSSGEDTFCHHCGARLIRRCRYHIGENRIQPGGRCPECGTEAAGVGMSGA